MSKTECFVTSGHDTASLVEKAHCKQCSWPIVEISSNRPLCPQSYWSYCANPSCENHQGERHTQFSPEFIQVEWPTPPSQLIINLLTAWGCWLSREKITHELGLSVPVADDALLKLENLGLIRFSKKSHLYCVLRPKL